MKTRYFLLLLLLIVASGISKAQNDNTNVYFPTSDTESENWTTKKDENGGIDLVYNGNRRVTDIYAVRFVDLGIIVNGQRVKFASVNIGAKNPWEVGNYYTSDEIEDDIAAKTFGSGFSLPTAGEWAALYNNCEWKWVAGYNGTNVNGYAVFRKKVSGVYSVETDKHIFIPAAGGSENKNIVSLGEKGWYWSAPTNQGSVLEFNSAEIFPSELNHLSYGFPVRPVMRKTASILLDKTEVLLSVNGKAKLTATTFNSDGKSVVWKSEDESIAIVDANGNVTGVSTGVTTITATIGNETITCIVTVKIPVTGVTLSGAEYANPYIWGSENVLSKTFTAAVTPDNATDKTVTWESSHPDIIEVSQSGEVKIIAPNETSGVLDVTISAISNDDNTKKGEYVIHLDNYVDLGTGEVYWKTIKESNQYTYNNAQTTFGSINIPSYDDYNRLIDKCDLQSGRITNKNRSSAYINWQPDNYWSNTFKPSSGTNGYNYCFTVSSLGTYSIDEADVSNALSVRCVHKYMSEVEVSVLLDKTVNLTDIVNPDGETVDIKWKSDDESIAKVDANGNVTGVSTGVTTITATIGNETITCIVTVKIPVTGVTLSGAEYANPYIWGSENVLSKTFTAAVTPDNATDKTVTWESSHPDIIEVSQSGEVEIIAPNETGGVLDVTISAISNDDNTVKGEYVIHLDNYVDLGTGEVYWKTTNESNQYAYNNAQTTFGSINIPSYDDYNRLIDKCDLQAGRITNKNRSSAYINWQPGNYWSNTFKRKGNTFATHNYNYNYTFVVNSSDNYSFGDAYVNNSLSVHCVRRYVNEASVMLNKTLDLKDIVNPNGEPVNIKWASDNSSIVAVNNGVVTGKAIGKATITAVFNGQTVSTVVTVLVPPESIILSGASYDNPYIWGTEDVEYKTFTATVLPENAADKSVIWESSDPDIITVDQDGKVKIIAPNETDGVLAVTITAMSGYDNNIKAEYVINLDNYVDLGTGEVYWKTKNETVTYTFSEDAIDRPSETDFQKAWDLRHDGDGGIKLQNNNKSGAYINLPYGDYWTNTSDNTLCIMYSFSNTSTTSVNHYDLMDNKHSVRCVKRYGNIKVARILIDGDFGGVFRNGHFVYIRDGQYVWGSDNSSSKKLRLKVEPSYASNKDVKWETNNTSLTSIEQDGTLTIIAPNESDENELIEITATAQDGSGVEGLYSFYLANYVDLGTRCYWYTKNAQDSKIFTYSEAESAYPDYSNETTKDTSKIHMPGIEDDIKVMFDTDKYTWTYNSNHTSCTVKNRTTGVYINFPLIQASTTGTWYAYRSWNHLALDYYHGLEFFHFNDNTYNNPPIDGHLKNSDRFPIRLVREKKKN